MFNNTIHICRRDVQPTVFDFFKQGNILIHTYIYMFIDRCRIPRISKRNVRWATWVTVNVYDIIHLFIFFVFEPAVSGSNYNQRIACIFCRFILLLHVDLIILKFILETGDSFDHSEEIRFGNNVFFFSFKMFD